MLADMHQDERGMVSPSHFGQAGIKAKATDVVDDAGTGARGLLRNLCFCRVNRNGQGTQALMHGANYRQYTTKFLLRRYRFGSGTSRLAAHVNPVRTLTCHLDAVLDRPLRIDIQPAVGERVRGYVEHAHDEGTFTQADFL